MQSHDLQLFADYFQFYLQDEIATGDLANSWSQEAVDRMLAVAPGVVGVGTVRNMTVPVTVQILDSEPSSDFASFDHVVEGSLLVKSGPLVVAGCTDYFPDAARYQISPGNYRVRVTCTGLDTLSQDGLDGQDHYRVQLWQAAHIEPAVLKQRAV